MDEAYRKYRKSTCCRRCISSISIAHSSSASYCILYCSTIFCNLFILLSVIPGSARTSEFEYQEEIVFGCGKLLLKIFRTCLYALGL